MYIYIYTCIIVGTINRCVIRAYFLLDFHFDRKRAVIPQFWVCTNMMDTPKLKFHQENYDAPPDFQNIWGTKLYQTGHIFLGG